MNESGNGPMGSLHPEAMSVLMQDLAGRQRTDRQVLETVAGDVQEMRSAQREMFAMLRTHSNELTALRMARIVAPAFRWLLAVAIAVALGAFSAVMVLDYTSRTERLNHERQNGP